MSTNIIYWIINTFMVALGLKLSCARIRSIHSKNIVSVVSTLMKRQTSNLLLDDIIGFMQLSRKLVFILYNMSNELEIPSFYTEYGKARIESVVIYSNRAHGLFIRI